MKISTKGRYALRMMIELARNYESGYMSIREVSKRQNISVKYLEQITAALTKAGFLESTRGPKGGHRLVRKPSDYTVGDILRVTEGDLAPISCLQDSPNRCPRAAECTTLSFWEGLYKAITDYCDSVTLEDIAGSDSSYNYFI